MSNSVDISSVAVAAANPASYQATYWLALSLTQGLGPSRIKKLIEHYGTAERVFEASLTELEATGMRAVSAQSIATGKSMELAQQECAKTVEAGARIISLSDFEYPSRLKEIYDPPVVLFVKGSIEVLAQPGIAVVGTRHPTPYGSGMAERLSTDLAARGLVIISGLARGIDTMSHRGAIAAKGKTVAVLGTGIDVMYPKENTRLAEQIVGLGGALISEFPVGTFPAPQNFPIRNRIISGMSAGVLVVEAAEYSGTRITSRLALEQNRDVYAVPGNVTNKNSWGPNTLIKQGAKLVATWEDVWEELPADVQVTLSSMQNESPEPETASLFPDEVTSPHEKNIFRLLKADESTHIDELVELLENQMPSSEIFAALFELELNGKIRQLPGKNFVKSFWLSGISYQSKPEEPVQSFRSLGVWEKRTTPTLDVYSSGKTFPREDMYGLTSQMRRASASIGMNIAEGCCRKGNVEMARFLQIAMGSGSELEYQLLLAHDLDYLRNLEYERLATQAVEVKRMLSSVVQKLITDN